jgi:putative transposase
MNTREIAAQYRLSQWSQALQERKMSGESIKDFCQKKGVSKNTYFYWQRKLRETVCQELIPTQQETESKAVVPSGWAVCEPSIEVVVPTAISIEIGKGRVNVNAGADPELLGKICRVLMSLC